MTTGHQIRAARALLEWSAERLASEAKVNRDTVHNLEKGAHQGKISTDKIVQVLSKKGIEFIGDRGVAFRHDDYCVLEGSDCYLQALDDVFQTIHGKHGAEALFICVDDSVSNEEVRVSNKRLHDAGIICRYLCSERAKRFDYPVRDYRAIPEQFYTNSVMIIYGDKVAILRGTNDAVVVVRDSDQANMLRGLFEMIWLQSPMPMVEK